MPVDNILIRKGKKEGKRESRKEGQIELLTKRLSFRSSIILNCLFVVSCAALLLFRFSEMS